MATRQVTTRARRRRGGLSRPQIARAALEIVDREGLEACTMQRVAAAVGAGTMTIYGYVRGKEDLLDAMVDAAVEDVEPAPGGGSWRDQLRELARTAHAMLVRHPALVQVRLSQPVLRPESLRFGEAALGILHEAGFDSREAAQAFRLLFTFVFGFAGLSPERTVDEARRRAAAAIAGLPPEDFPNLTRAAAEASMAMAGEEQFEYGLERILDGLETRLP